MEDFLQLATDNQERAWQVINETGIKGIWERNGAEVNLVGSLKTGLLMKHLDIDFHVYTRELNITESFRIMSALAETPGISKVEYTNLIDTEEKCIEWHAYYVDKQHDIWQLDIIQILKGSRYDGFFENVAEQISKLLTPELREIILKLKYDTPDYEKIPGIMYYQAAIVEGIKDYKDFNTWIKNNPCDGIVETDFSLYHDKRHD